ncbi:transposase family protein [Roseinatronobacter monicus]|uniref:transposase family protein n=1 Tax=Roseinatronobacter monicus TaxID=393481 RepID=UPI0014771919
MNFAFYDLETTGISPAVALPLNRLCLTLCGATILKLENSGGIVVSSKKHWSPGSDVAVQSVERSESGGWIVSGVLAPNGICPDCGLHSRRRHGWRRRRLQDYPAHGDGVTVDLAVCRWRCLASACPESFLPKNLTDQPSLF